MLVAFIALPALSATGQLPQLNDLFVLEQGRGPEAGEGGGAAQRRARSGGHAARQLRVRRQARAGHPGPHTGRGGQRRPELQHHAGRPLRATRAASRSTATWTGPATSARYYDTALLFPTNAVRLDGTSGGVAVLDMSNPAKPVETAQADRAADAQPARVAGAEHQARAAGGGAGQPVDLPGPGVDLRREPGLPQAGAAVNVVVGAPRPRERLLGGRQDLLRHRRPAPSRSRRST